ncbi:MAG TPA: hypothetical protein VHL58_07850 [Thermoanaerobaculia bacterium]|nr:hypothetical protein [Thermoanaerobaculia bacterium]
MKRFLRNVLWGPPLPLIGWIPWNLLWVAGTVYLGMSHHLLWGVGGVGELIYLPIAGLLAYPVDARGRMSGSALLDHTSADVSAKTNRLKASSRTRLAKLEAQAHQIVERSRASDDLMSEANREALLQIIDLFLDLLISRDELDASDREGAERELQRQVATLETELREPALSPATKQSKEATLAATHERQQHLHNRETRLTEIDSDLQRIETEMGLLVDRSLVQKNGVTVPGRLELVQSLYYEEPQASPDAPAETYSAPSGSRES